MFAFNGYLVDQPGVVEKKKSTDAEALALLNAQLQASGVFLKLQRGQRQADEAAVKRAAEQAEEKKRAEEERKQKEKAEEDRRRQEAEAEAEKQRRAQLEQQQHQQLQ